MRQKASFGHGLAWIVRNPGYREQPVAVCSLEIPLAANVSTILRWRARPDDGKHSGR
jgi:hypothetical protein